MQDNIYKAVLWKIYQHFFWEGYKYRRQEMKTDIEAVLNMPDAAKGRVYHAQRDREQIEIWRVMCEEQKRNATGKRQRIKAVMSEDA